MIYTINSLLIPLFLKQGVLDNTNKKIGYITATNITRQLLGEMSYKAKIYNTECTVIEQKKKNNERNWRLYIITNNSRKEVGRLILKSNTAQTLRNTETNYNFIYENRHYQINKPYMQSKKPFSMTDENGKEIACHKKMNYLDRNRKIKIFNSNNKALDASIVLVMSVVKYIS